jgi:hypothetical protein
LVDDISFRGHRRQRRRAVHRHRPGHGDFGGLTGNFGDVFMVRVDGESVVGVMGGDASE